MDTRLSLAILGVTAITFASVTYIGVNAGQHGAGRSGSMGMKGPGQSQNGAMPAPRLLKPDDKETVSRGATIYVEQCASCHGKNLEGQANWRTRLPNGRLPAPPHDETGHTWHHPDRLLFRLTKEGPAAMIGKGYESDMPGFAGTLSDADIVAVLSYIKSRWPAEVRARHDRMNRHRR